MNNVGVRTSQSQKQLKQRLFYRTAGTSGFGLSQETQVDLIMNYRPRHDPIMPLPELRRAGSIGKSSLDIVEHSPHFNLQSETSGQSQFRNSRDHGNSEDAHAQLLVARSSSQNSILPNLNVNSRRATGEPSLAYYDSHQGITTDRIGKYSNRYINLDNNKETFPGTVLHGSSLELTARELQFSQMQNKGLLEETTLTRGMNTSSIMNATTLRTGRQPSRRQLVGEGYSQLRLCSVRDNDIFLLTQARQEKTKRMQHEGQRLAAWVKQRVAKVKAELEKDRFLEEFRLSDTLKIMLLVSNEELCEFICLEKMVATAKAIEHFVVLYHLRQECTTVQSTRVNNLKLIQRLKEFLCKSRKGAFEIKVDSEASLQLFRDLTECKRPFLDTEDFFPTSPIEAIVLSYLFLEYKVSFEKSTFNRMASQLSLNLYDDEDQKANDSNDGPVDTRTAEQKALDELNFRNQELNKRIIKMRAELLQTRVSLEENGEFIYNSKNLKIIEMCIANKDILFDMNGNTFDTMLELTRPVIDKALYSQHGMSVKAKNLFLELMSLRQIFSEENRTMGNKLKNELEIDLADFYKVEKHHQRNEFSVDEEEKVGGLQRQETGVFVDPSVSGDSKMIKESQN